MTKILKLALGAAFGIAAFGTSTGAAPVVYSGLDVAATDLASAPTATAAAAAFDLALGSFSISDFETAPTAFTTSGGTNLILTNGFTFFGGNTTAGGDNYLQNFGSSVTFTFATAVQAFGAFFSGWQVDGQTLHINYSDFSVADLVLPDGDISLGGLLFFGFIDAGKSIASITYTAGIDIVGVDDVRTSSVSAVPIPAALPLFAAGLSAMGFMGWRKRRKALV